MIKFQQNIYNTELQRQISNAAKPTLDELIAFAAEREIWLKSSTLLECSVCKKNHFETDCTENSTEKKATKPETTTSTANKSNKTIVCVRCKAPGHYAAYCFSKTYQPSPSNRQPNRNNSNSSGNWNKNKNKNNSGDNGSNAYNPNYKGNQNNQYRQNSNQTSNYQQQQQPQQSYQQSAASSAFRPQQQNSNFQFRGEQNRNINVVNSDQKNESQQCQQSDGLALPFVTM